MKVNKILNSINETGLIMDIDAASMKVCIRVNSGDDVGDHIVFTDERGNDFIVVGSVFDTHGYDNEYGGNILMDLHNAGITLADVIVVPEFMPGTWYSIGLDEWDDIVWVTHESDEPETDGIVEIESWI